MILFLTSSPTGPLDNSRHVDGIDSKNYLIENFQKYWKPDSKCLYITATPDNYELNDEIRSGMKATWEKGGFSIASFDVWDNRTADFSKETLSIEKNVTNNDELFDYNHEFKGKTYNLNAVFMTTHHLVIPVDDLEITDEVGEYFCTHPMFKKMINVNFVQVIDENTIKLRTYERGCGWTGACGSGSSSSVVVLNRKGFVNKEVKVLYKYGTLTIKLINGEVFMQGPAQRIANKINYFV